MLTWFLLRQIFKKANSNILDVLKIAEHHSKVSKGKKMQLNTSSQYSDVKGKSKGYWETSARGHTSLKLQPSARKRMATGIKGINSYHRGLLHQVPSQVTTGNFHSRRQTEAQRKPGLLNNT